MRLLRIIKLARRWTALQDILGKIFKSLSELSIFCALLLLFMYIFALLGMQFFSKRAYTDLEDIIVPADEILERI
jgi:sensor histidine kinase YesM